MKKITFSVLACLAMLTACKKEEKTTSSTTFKTIADKKWQLTAYTSFYSGSTYDAYASIPACNRDNLWTLKSDKTNEVDEGATKCNASDPQTLVIGTWELRNEDKNLFVKGLNRAAPSGQTELTFTILEISSTILKLQYTTNTGGPTVVNTITYSAK